MNHIVKSKIDEAEDHYYRAKEELCKPEEDVVPYGVCQNAYYAVVNYLSGVLLNNDRKLPEPMSISDLLETCRQLNPKYNDLHLSPMYHPKASEDVWMNIETAMDYMEMAKNTRQMINLI